MSSKIHDTRFINAVEVLVVHPIICRVFYIPNGTCRGSRTCTRRCDRTTGADASVENGDMGLGNTNIWHWKDVFFGWEGEEVGRKKT